MILNLLNVASLDFIQKSVQDLLVDLRHNLKKIHVTHNLCSDNLECMWPAYLLEGCMYVEILSRNLSKNIGSQFEMLNLLREAWVSASSRPLCTL